ncbi:MAG: hypothetical protein K6G26_07750 [Lachnospiraceae bacterium]|nr:hypothetical protein [Lachnospiraceae bacterium]
MRGKKHFSWLAYTALFVLAMTALTSCKDKKKTTKEIQQEILNNAVPEVTRSADINEESQKDDESAVNVTVVPESEAKAGDVIGNSNGITVIKERSSRLDTMKPVIMAVADALKDNYYDYNPNSNSLYFDAIYYLASYSKDFLKNKYKDNGDGTVTLSDDSLKELSSACFAGRVYGYKEMLESDYPADFVPDKSYKNYTLPVKQTTVKSVEILSVNEKVFDDNSIAGNLYEAEVKVNYSDCEKVLSMSFITNELGFDEENVLYSYSVQSAGLAR